MEQTRGNGHVPADFQHPLPAKRPGDGFNQRTVDVGHHGGHRDTVRRHDQLPTASLARSQAALLTGYAPPTPAAILPLARGLPYVPLRSADGPTYTAEPDS